jgi:hypothetical protein
MVSRNNAAPVTVWATAWVSPQWAGEAFGAAIDRVLNVDQSISMYVCGERRARTNTQEPRPSADQVNRYEEIWNQGMKHVYSSPYIERVVSVVRKQEWVVNPGRIIASRISKWSKEIKRTNVKSITVILMIPKSRIVANVRLSLTFFSQNTSGTKRKRVLTFFHQTCASTHRGTD